MKNNLKRIGVMFLFIFTVVLPVNAATSGALAFSGNDTHTLNSSFTLDIAVVNNGGTITTVGGQVTVSDSNCLKLEKVDYVDDNSDVNGTKFSFFSQRGKAGNFTIARATFKAGAASCSTNVNLVGSNITFTNNDINSTNISKKITIIDNNPTPSKSSDATLSSLTPNVGSLSPSFNKDTMNYSLTVGSDVGSVNFTTSTTDEKATVSGNTCNLTGESTTCKIVVTAEDGTKKEYTVNVNKTTNGDSNPSGGNQPTGGNKPSGGNSGGNTSGGTSSPASKSTDNTLKSLIVNDGMIKPNFNKDISNYSIIVPNQVTSLNLKAIANDPKAKVVINGNSNFQIGSNVVTIRVTADDGSVRNYVINVERSEKESQNKLEQLVINGGSIKPNFNPDVYEYDIDVPSNTDKIDVNAIPANSNAKVEVIGNDNLKEGNNAVLVRVTDENGFSQYYRLNVNRGSSNKKFLGLTWGQWFTLLGFLLLVGLLLLILFLVLRKKDDEEEPAVEAAVPPTPTMPTFEFKPEFNFGSKNGTDDHIVEPGGVLNQYTGTAPELTAKDKLEEADYAEIPYDPYDDVVTKDEMYDALDEAMKTKDPSKLQMLYNQEKLNREKEEMKKNDQHYE